MRARACKGLNEGYWPVRATLQAVRTPLLAAGLGLLALAAGCAPAGGSAGDEAGNEAPTGEVGYRAPPDLTGVTRTAAGIELSGRAAPGVKVRVATPQGQAAFANADERGGWRLTVPASSEPRLFGLSVADSGRVIQAQGYLFLAPDGIAARLRAGGGTEFVGPAAQGLAVTAVDWDKALAASVSGSAAPGEGVTVRIDGIARADATTDEAGRFVAPLTQPLSEGAHDLDLFGAGGEIHLQATVTPPAPLTGAPFHAERGPTGWRIDWLTPGGGEQTTVLVTAAPQPGPGTVPH